MRGVDETKPGIGDERRARVGHDCRGKPFPHEPIDRRGRDVALVVLVQRRDPARDRVPLTQPCRDAAVFREDDVDVTERRRRARRQIPEMTDRRRDDVQRRPFN